MRGRRAAALLLAVAGFVVGEAAAKNLATIDGKGLSDEAFIKAAEGLGPRGPVLLSHPTSRRQFLDQLIDTQLLAKTAEEKGLAKSERFAEQLADARKQILATIYAESYVAENATDVKLLEYFNKDPKRFNAQEVKASHIILPTEADAAGVLAEAQKPGADFEALAKKHSTGPSGPKGGELGFFGRGRMVPEFEDAAFATAKGSVHPKPVKTQFGWHVIKVADVRGDEAVKFEDVKAKVKTQLETELRVALVQDLRQKAKVAVDEDAVKTLQY